MGAVGWLVIAPDDYVHLIQRVIVLTAFLALAGYLARQVHQHRTMANWARSLSVQLQTFDAFIDAVESPDVKDDLRTAFAAREFGGHPAVKGEPAVPASGQAVGQLTETINKILPSGNSQPVGPPKYVAGQPWSKSAECGLHVLYSYPCWNGVLVDDARSWCVMLGTH